MTCGEACGNVIEFPSITSDSTELVKITVGPLSGAPTGPRTAPVLPIVIAPASVSSTPDSTRIVPSTWSGTVEGEVARGGKP